MTPAAMTPAAGRVPRATVAAAVATLLSAILTMTAAACDGRDRGSDRASPPVEPMSQAELDRGVQACRAYVERACACAGARPDNAAWRQSCDLGPGRVDALEMLFSANRGDISDNERLITQAKARKMIASCIEDANAFDARGCPRAERPGR